ncbi:MULTISPECIES: OadG family protein [unclassified Fusibacter]|uniref:OadG family protein n=1 Tax=unclassified Fusibacter TaxID=2624464 RepID=UPI0010108082|nr:MULTISPECIES: OadG family protein [unclassified Fusibacter]MCK8059545.1 OadG family protein [Fusibacter sp. A2]NPE20991.1 OadG family protein [Fusibacter sp. A1]RXV62265.1 sodium pump decarboxylase subunit gamma [Fusibacter sp. A1]
MDLINKLSDPALLETMTVGDKLTAGLMVTLIGMTITVLALLILWGAIVVMTKLIVKQPKQAVQVVKHEPATVKSVVVEETEDNDELIAVITAAIAASLKTSIHNVVVKNIVRIPDETPAWASKGRVDQMNARF